MRVASNIAQRAWKLKCFFVRGLPVSGKNMHSATRFIKCLCVISACVVAAFWAPATRFTSAADGRLTAAIPKAAKFQFARMRYPGGIPDFVKNWYTDYPNMDEHFTALLAHLTGVEVGPPFVIEPSSPAMFDFPLIYSVEPEQMVLGPREITNLQEYLARGGLWFADDFHGDEEFNQFLRQIRKVIPGAKPVELSTSHPLFHCFYDINKIVQVTNDSIAKCAECDQWENGPSGRIPKVFAVLDEHGRIEILMAWNTDLGDGLEWADDPEYPAEYSAYAFRFISNVVVYAMSH
jgi:Domain of unknown function (DUF4159)